MTAEAEMEAKKTVVRKPQKLPDRAKPGGPVSAPMQPGDNGIGLLTSHLCEKSIPTALSYHVWGNLLQQPGEANASPELHTLAALLLLLSLLLFAGWAGESLDISCPLALLLVLPTHIYYTQVSQAYVGVSLHPLSSS